MKIYLAIGLICLLSVSAFAYIVPRDDNHVPASVICDKDQNFLVIHPNGSVYVITTTNSVILSIIRPVTTYMTISQFDEIIEQFVLQYVLSSTNTAAILTEMDKQYVLISTSGDSTVTRLDTINTELIKHYVLSSTNTATILAELISEYVLMSTGADTTIARLDTINTELIEHYILSSTNTATIMDELVKHYVLSSTNTVGIINELIKMYVLTSTGTDMIISTLESIGTNTLNIYNQLKTSVTTSDILYSGKVSSSTAGKSFTSGSLSIVGGMEFYMFYTVGGNATITGNWFGGTKYVLEGIPFKPDKLSIPFTNPVFDYVLDSGTTLYYDTHIVKQP